MLNTIRRPAQPRPTDVWGNRTRDDRVVLQNFPPTEHLQLGEFDVPRAKRYRVLESSWAAGRGDAGKAEEEKNLEALDPASELHGSGLLRCFGRPWARAQALPAPFSLERNRDRGRPTSQRPKLPPVPEWPFASNLESGLIRASMLLSAGVGRGPCV